MGAEDPAREAINFLDGETERKILLWSREEFCLPHAKCKYEK